mmetsp:Transcript_1723/g.2615  ORF Transcript_1723/g.2615 Transcript_1723/m.2615 type:complete len:280 (-) Transcript_1723:45-884(-)
MKMMDLYKLWLEEYPLITKMATGGVLSLGGDAIAQIRSKPRAAYCKRRAAGFVVFDMFYRAIQHTAFPIIVSLCQGEMLTLIIVGSIADELNTTTTNILAAVEQTLANQLVIVPFLYYPIFFLVTGFVQGMSYKQTLERARKQFPMLIKRSFAFWLPVHFIQFMFVEEDFQVPFISLIGLCWTVILSSIAGGCIAKSMTVLPHIVNMSPITATTNGPFVFAIQNGAFDKVKEEDRCGQSFRNYSIRRTLAAFVFASIVLSLIRHSILSSQFLHTPSMMD